MNAPDLEGLSSAEAAARLARDGPNALPEPARRTGWKIAADAAREPMFLLLCGGALLYLLLGEALEGAFLLVMVAATIGMTLYQEGKTEHALQALRQLGSPQALVLRDGLQQRVPARDLVCGDVILLAEGARVPADALLLSCHGICADESLLTGESVPVRKSTEGPRDAARPGGDDLPWVYAGTLVVQGQGRARVAATGIRSEIGKIGASLREVAPPPSPLQVQTAVLARRFALLGIGISLLLVLLLGWRNGRWLEALLAGVALSISVMPEEFTVVLTVFPALGAWRLARANVLTRRLAALETLGATSTLCVDKTGTLTENRMDLRLLWREGEAAAPTDALPPALAEVLRVALLATPHRSHDPLEHALLRHADCLTGGAVPADWHIVHEYPLSSERRALMQAWDRPGDMPLLACKGAPETVVALCRLAAGERQAALDAAAAMARDGLRVLAIASAVHAGAWPDDPSSLSFELVGLCGLADPLRADIPPAVAACRDAGLRVVMITGDHPATALAIAAQAGLRAETAVTGPELETLDEAALAARLSNVDVCARIVPQQKLAIVRALQRGAAVVAMTGDGVNDAPALRAADVGIAMGQRGTDVAREAADLTLLDDRFASIVAAIASGRRIYANLKKAMAYVAAIHAPIAGMALLPALFGWPVLLYPVHIVFLELVIDPACALMFENEPAERDAMRQPPRPRGSELFGRRAIAAALGEGLAVLALVAPAYWFAVTRLPADEARAAGFAALVLCNLALLLTHRVRDGGLLAALRIANPVFSAISGTALATLALALYVPWVAALFKFAAPPPVALAGALGVAVALVAGLEVARRIGRRR